MKSPTPTPRPPDVTTPAKGAAGISLRAVIIGLVATALVDLWVHYAELALGGARGHTAIVNTSIPVGPFNVLFALVFVNLAITHLAPRFRFSQAELLTIYVMCAVSTVLSSSGGLHALIPAITAVHYFGEAAGWKDTLYHLIPSWLVQKDPAALKSFYRGSGTVELVRWVKPIAVWGGFMLVFACATLCLSLILRKQWIQSEHLAFPTVALPLELAREGTPLLKDRVFWAGAGLTFAIVWWNTLSYNVPNVPSFSMRGIDLTQSFTAPPWNAIGSLKLTFFPFAIGIGYLLSTEVVFSVWFFYLFSKAQAVWGSIAGWSDAGAANMGSQYPYLIYQGGGAFLGLAIASIWISRRHLATVFRTAFTRGPSTDPEARGYKIAVFGLIASVLAMIVFTVAAGASRPIAALFVALVLVYLLAATRIRAETGNAWPVGPEIDAFKLLVTFGGSAAFRATDLTALTYIRAATAGQDFRSACMPHELDGLKIADSAGIKPGKMALAMVVAIAFGVVVSFIIAVVVWTHMGALAKADPWRSMAGRRSFDVLNSWLKSPVKPDAGGMLGIGIGVAFTMFLAYMRTAYVWWPFHPVGYCMSNTFTSYNLWMPCFIAWLAKVIITRSGGMKLYRRALPFFFGLIAGDFLGGGLTTLVGCFTSINVYPANW